MKILIGDNGNVDFDSPVQMTSEQKDKLIEFLRSMFAIVEEEPASEFRTDRIGDKFFMRSWTSSEHALLLEIEDTSKVAEKLGRSWMSVDIKRGEFLPEFLMWAHEKNKDLLKGNINELIEEFMKTKQEKIKEKRKRRREKKTNIEKIDKEIATLQRRKNLIMLTHRKDEYGKKISELKKKRELLEEKE